MVDSQATPGSITEPNLACEVEIELATYALGQPCAVYDPGLRAIMGSQRGDKHIYSEAMTLGV